MPATTNADLTKIFGTAIYGIVDDLATAKDNGQKLPGFLDDVATLASNAKKSGIDLVQSEVKSKMMEYLPWGLAGIALIVIIILVAKRK